MSDLSKFIVPNYDKAGIYAIINKTKMRAYIGQSRNIKKRAEQHKTKIKNKNHDVEEINTDFDDEFSFLVLHRFYDENVSNDKIGIYEKLYMLTLVNAGFELYNKNEIGQYVDVKSISWMICSELLFNIGAMENLSDAYFEKYGKHYSYDIKKRKNK